MSQISITVGPKSYTVNCADGEEDHIRSLAAIIDDKYAALGSARAPQEVQNLLFAALFLADELAEARKAGGSGSAAVPDVPDSNASPSEIEALARDLAESRAEADDLRNQLAQSRTKLRAQHDLFAGDNPQDEIAETLEALATRAEEIAASLEAGAQPS